MEAEVGLNVSVFLRYLGTVPGTQEGLSKDFLINEACGAFWFWNS